MPAQRPKVRGTARRTSIREATLDDARQISTLVTALGYPTNASDMRERLEGLIADGAYVTFVAEHAAEIIGMAGACTARFYEKNGTYARLVALVVSEDRHGKGVGAWLVRAVERWANGKGAAEIFLNSGVQREGARRFYEKLGYRVTGVRFSKELPAGEAR
jgi:GNAT superfamily N-acetyltransferase